MLTPATPISRTISILKVHSRLKAFCLSVVIIQIACKHYELTAAYSKVLLATVRPVMPDVLANDVSTYKRIPQLHVVYMFYVHVNRPTNYQIKNPAASKFETILQNSPDQTDGDFA